MRTPFLWLSLGFFLGTVASRYISVPVIPAILGLGLGMLLLWYIRGRKLFRTFFVLLLSVAALLWAQMSVRVLPEDVRNFTGPHRIALCGVVEALPELKIRGKRTTVSLILKARSITRQEGSLVRKQGEARLSSEIGRWKFQKVTGLVQVFLLQSAILPQVGDELRLYGVLSAPRTVHNPGEFDHKSFLAQKNIHSIFQTIGKRSVRVIKDGNPWGPARLIAETRRQLASMIDKLYKPEQSAILKALVLGLRSDVAPDVRSQFMKTGTIHLLAISGLNITMIAGSLYMLFLVVGLGYRWSTLLTILMVAVYVGLAGAGLPVQRAAYASIVLLVGILLGRPVNLLNAMCFAFFAMLLWEPQSLWNVGFQLSFLCVFSLILVFPLLTRLNIGMLSLGSGFAVLIGTFPMVLYYFNVFSPISLVANLGAIPLFDAALFCALLTLIFSGVPFLSSLLLKGSSWVLVAGLYWVEMFSELRLGYWFFERPSKCLLLAYYASVVLILFFWKRIFRGQRFVLLFCVGCWILCVSAFFIHSGKKGFELTLLANAKGQIAYANFSNGARWLLNAGRGFPADQVEWQVLPFLRSQGIQRLDGVMFSDLSRKHAGGLGSLLRDFPVRYLLYPAGHQYEKVGAPVDVRSMRRTARAFRKGDEIVMEAERIRVLALSTKGTAFLLESGSWRIVFVSHWDPELFSELLSGARDVGEVHAVFLPMLSRRPPAEFDLWFDSVQPLLLILSDIKAETNAYLEALQTPFLDLKSLGAISFKSQGSRLELFSFLKGSLGAFLY